MKARGRQKISEIERKRRAALRQHIKAQELTDYLRAAGDNKDEIDAMTGPGRRPKPTSYRVDEAWALFETMFADVRVIEEQESLEHVPLDQVHDPLVERGTVNKVGRKPKDEFTVLDRELLNAERQLDSAYKEWEEAGVDTPERVITDGRARGRKPTPYPERVNELLLEIEGIQLEIKKREEELSKTELIERQLKLLRDFARTVRNALKKGGVEPERGQSLLERTQTQIENYVDIIDRITRLKEEYTKDLRSMRREMIRPTLYAEVMNDSERKLAETEGFERKNVVAEELRQKSELLSMMIDMRKKKQQIVNTQREIARIEKEIKDMRGD